MKNNSLVFRSLIFVGVLCPLLLPLQAGSAIYKYVDEDGNVQYSNVVPPKSATVVDTTREVVVRSEVVEQRREDKRVQMDASFERSQQEAEKAERRAERERREAERQRQRAEEEQQDLVRKMREEKRSILQREQKWLAKCDGLDTGFLIIQECREKVQKRTKKDLRKLRRSTDSYFDHIFSNRGDSDRFFDSLYKQLSKKMKKQSRKREYQTR